MINIKPQANFGDAIAHEQLRELYFFWQSCCHDGKYPRQKDIQLSIVPHLVSNCYIMDVLEDQKFINRFVGTNIDRHLGISLTGKHTDEYRRGTTLKTQTDFFTYVSQTGMCGHLITRMSSEANEHLIYHRSAMPLSDDGVTINKLLGGWYHHPIDSNSPPLYRVDTTEYEQTALMSVTYEDSLPDKIRAVS